MRAVLVSALLLVGCFPRSAALDRLVQALSGMKTGWFAVHPEVTLDGDGAPLLPPAATLDEEDSASYMERLERAHLRQLHPVALDSACAGTPGGGTLYLLVHGLGGVGTEWVAVFPTLAKTRPAGLYMYRWFPYAERGTLVFGLVEGIEALSRCHPDAPVVVLGHSAGGVLAAYAAGRLRLAPGRRHPVTLVTVASPLAGVAARPEIEDAGDGAHFVADLGSAHRGYPAAGPGAQVLHLRTHYPADTVMKPTRSGYAPNALSAVVKGSRVLDLPDTLGHDEALLYVARRIESGELP